MGLSAESRTFFATPKFITFLAKVELTALLTVDVITFLANVELVALKIR